MEEARDKSLESHGREEVVIVHGSATQSTAPALPEKIPEEVLLNLPAHVCDVVVHDEWKLTTDEEKESSQEPQSRRMCMKSQLIDLEEEGYNPSFMDQFQPDIKISEWYVPRHDCGCQYHIHVELLDQRKKPIQTFAPDTVYFEQWNDQKWNQMTHVFQNYGPGVRYIQFIHGGKDTQFWAGWYGIRVTDSRVEICPSKDL
ncbi:hypothetical protein LDENG_00185750 [Lucifuga dentata]|nr:hypothetical protein LDENG_00185750 [Lucifuga dentata]